MEINKIQGFVLLLVFIGMLLGVGVLTLDKYSRAVRTTTTIQDDGVNLSNDAATLSQTYCLAITSATFANGTAVSTSTYNFTYSDADTCAITSNVPDNAVLYNVTYTYGAATSATTTATNVNTAITPIASTWLPLIVTVFVLAIIMGLVISSFTGKR